MTACARDCAQAERWRQANSAKNEPRITRIKMDNTDRKDPWLIRVIRIASVLSVLAEIRPGRLRERGACE